MLADPNTLSQILLSISSDEPGKFDTYYDGFLLQIKTPQYDDISAGNVLLARVSDLVYHTTWASLFYISILWIARSPLREKLCPLDQPPDQVQDCLVCTCVHGSMVPLEAQPLPSQSGEHTSWGDSSRPSTSALVQTTGSLDANSPKNENLTEEKNASNDKVLDNLQEDVDGLPKRPPSPGRASQVAKGLAQASDPYHATTDGPSICLSCGGSTIAQRTKRAGGRTELIVQDESLALTTEPGYTPDSCSAPSSPTDSAPLIRTLNHGSSEEPAQSDDLDSISALDILVVAKNDLGGERPLRGPQNDTNYLRDEFGTLQKVRFRAILDFDATLDHVRDAITDLRRNAHAGSHLFFFLTGHGTNNEMALHGGDSIGERYIQNLLQPDETDPKQLRTIVIFDICRDNQDKGVADMGSEISLVWSCSPGQRAGSIGFKSHAPGSFFLNALFRAYQDVCENRPGSPEDHLQTRVKQLTLYTSYRSHLEGEPKCKVCIRDRVWCSEAFVMQDEDRQNIDLSQAQGDLKRLFDFLRQEGYNGKLPDGIQAFFAKLKLFEERSKYDSQMWYLLRNPRDTQAWQGWLSWLAWSIWEYIWILLIHILAFNQLTGGSCGKRVGAQSEKRRSGGVDQAPSPDAAAPGEAQPPNLSKPEFRGANVSVATAQAPALV